MARIKKENRNLIWFILIVVAIFAFSNLQQGRESIQVTATYYDPDGNIIEPETNIFSFFSVLAGETTEIPIDVKFVKLIVNVSNTGNVDANFNVDNIELFGNTYPSTPSSILLAPGGSTTFDTGLMDISDNFDYNEIMVDVTGESIENEIITEHLVFKYNRENPDVDETVENCYTGPASHYLDSLCDNDAIRAQYTDGWTIQAYNVDYSSKTDWAVNHYLTGRGVGTQTSYFTYSPEDMRPQGNYDDFVSMYYSNIWVGASAVSDWGNNGYGALAISDLTSSTVYTVDLWTSQITSGSATQSLLYFKKALPRNTAGFQYASDNLEADPTKVSPWGVNLHEVLLRFNTDEDVLDIYYNCENKACENGVLYKSLNYDPSKPLYKVDLYFLSDGTNRASGSVSLEYDAGEFGVCESTEWNNPSSEVCYGEFVTQISDCGYTRVVPGMKSCN